MRVLVGLAMAACATVNAFCAGAPDSVSGKVYKHEGGIASLRTVASATYVFETDGRFTTVMSASSSTVDLRFDRTQRNFLTSAPEDGSYSYTKIDDSTATLHLQFDGGRGETLNMSFDSATLGTSNTVFRFTLTDVSDFVTAPALSISTRGVVAPGHPMIVGFAVPGRYPTLADPRGTNQREVLIRAVGPSLVDFGVVDVWADPDFEVVRLGDSPKNTRPGFYGDWTTIQYYSSGGNLVSDSNPGGADAFRKIFDFVGAFQLLDDSRDAVDFIRLYPGAYTVVASVGPNDPGGEVLVEVYFLP
jgi:hypothetical protein